jgi:PAS domain S-box-containing protein
MRQNQEKGNLFYSTEEADFIRLYEMKTMLESITDGFFAVNGNWEFTYVNKESERLLEHARENLIGRNIWECFAYGKDSKFYIELQKASKQETSVHFEYFVADKEQWLVVNAYPLRGGLAVYFKDITEEKEYLTQIEDRNKLLTDIAWVQAHKIRGPVANILGLSKLFNYDNIADPINKDILQKLRDTVNDLDIVIKEVVQKTNLTINSK